jgi:hypothetical protein
MKNKIVTILALTIISLTSLEVSLLEYIHHCNQVTKSWYQNFNQKTEVKQPPQGTRPPIEHTLPL